MSETIDVGATERLKNKTIWCYCKHCRCISQDPAFWNNAKLALTECSQCGGLETKTIVVNKNKAPPSWWLKRFAE